mmetsp:Transcript_12369/g.20809  ORF Transcript_12369/g.20809 Transcript_12369/m.20809 type:complete len:257 (-) Transcript_12369:995-1765(-)
MISIHQTFLLLLIGCLLGEFLDLSGVFGSLAGRVVAFVARLLGRVVAKALQIGARLNDLVARHFEVGRLHSADLDTVRVGERDARTHAAQHLVHRVFHVLTRGGQRRLLLFVVGIGQVLAPGLGELFVATVDERRAVAQRLLGLGVLHLVRARLQRFFEVVGGATRVIGRRSELSRRHVVEAFDHRHFLFDFVAQRLEVLWRHFAATEITFAHRNLWIDLFHHIIQILQNQITNTIQIFACCRIIWIIQITLGCID